MSKKFVSAKAVLAELSLVAGGSWVCMVWSWYWTQIWNRVDNTALFVFFFFFFQVLFISQLIDMWHQLKVLDFMDFTAKTWFTILTGRYCLHLAPALVLQFWSHPVCRDVDRTRLQLGAFQPYLQLHSAFRGFLMQGVPGVTGNNCLKVTT